ncbi:DUF551 domain-containing protein [Edwardsiella tarda]|uniref:DUF551 domain-containing protein n=1 Tax=Edwardsiella tarda TaxID=636 RepID=UPI003F65EC2F
MTTITKERLIKIQQWRETYGAGHNVILPAEEAEELARIALAALEAKPVAWTDEEELRDVEKISCGYLFTVNPISENADPRRVIYLYTAPIAPVLPDGYPAEIRELMASYSDALFNDEDAQEIWNACRAAMLQDEPVSPAYKLHDDWVSCSGRLPDTDTYVLVSNGFWVGVGKYSDDECLDTGENWQDEHGEFIDLIHHPVTHWMSLPAAPPQESLQTQRQSTAPTRRHP